MGELVDLNVYRSTRSRQEARVATPELPYLEPHAGWVPTDDPCYSCGRMFEGLEIRIGVARFHARRGSCREAALAWLTPAERVLAETAKRCGLWPTDTAGVTLVVDRDAQGRNLYADSGAPRMVDAQATFPARS